MNAVTRAIWASLLAALLLASCAGPAPTPTLLSAPESTTPPTLTATPTAVHTLAPAPSPTPTATPVAASPKTLKGVSLSPKSFAAADFTDFFKKAREAGEVVTWAGDWYELGGVSGGPKVVTELAPTYGYIPVVLAQVFTQSTGRLLRPLDEATVNAYKDSARAFAERYKPKYLGLGIEVNMLYEKSPADFDAVAQLISETYDAVKSVSPDTKVFTVFQLEKMKGLSGGLFGGVNDPAKAQWQLLDRFPKSDIIAFTTYPGLVMKDPAEIPPDYYTEIMLRTSKPIAFTEMGWHTESSPRGWESSEAEQGAFVKAFFSLTTDLDTEMAIWSFLFDQNTIEPFRSMGMLRADGAPRPAWEEWVGVR